MQGHDKTWRSVGYDVLQWGLYRVSVQVPIPFTLVEKTKA